jgi:outer membrane protein assembly factor BamB
VTAHRLKDGSEIWRSGGLNSRERYNPSFRLVASPVASPGLIVVPSAKNGPVLALKPDSQGDVTSVMKQQHWKLPRGTPDVPSPLIHEGIVYLCRENGDLTAVDSKTGQILYTNHTHQGRHRASPVYADGKVYLTSRNGIVSVVKAGRQFELLSQNHMEEQIAASPAISNGRIYLRTFQSLFAIGK